MAQPIPCAICPDGTDASWLLTARDESTGLDPGTTVAICASCWPTFVIASAKAMLDPDADGPPAATGDDATEPSGDAAVIPSGATDGPDGVEGQGDTGDDGGPKSNGHAPPEAVEDDKAKAATASPAAND